MGKYTPLIDNFGYFPIIQRISDMGDINFRIVNLSSGPSNSKDIREIKNELYEKVKAIPSEQMENVEKHALIYEIKTKKLTGKMNLSRILSDFDEGTPEDIVYERIQKINSPVEKLLYPTYVVKRKPRNKISSIYSHLRGIFS